MSEEGVMEETHPYTVVVGVSATSKSPTADGSVISSSSFARVWSISLTASSVLPRRASKMVTLAWRSRKRRT